MVKILNAATQRWLTDSCHLFSIQHVLFLSRESNGLICYFLHDKITNKSRTMVKFGKNKLKQLNKLAKKQNSDTNNAANSNKVLKKKQNAEKKVTFQKKVLLKETLAEGNSLVKNLTNQELQELRREKAKNATKKLDQQQKVEVMKPKIKSVERKKKRQQTLKNDTRLLYKLMNKKKE